MPKLVRLAAVTAVLGSLSLPALAMNAATITCEDFTTMSRDQQVQAVTALETAAGDTSHATQDKHLSRLIEVCTGGPEDSALVSLETLIRAEG